ncbi:MAG: hypothetical protein M1831_003703 [Alyxoria varia]|nr:MAG: hypothetical protein M1831_003703 [Alyxoria varia]
MGSSKSSPSASIDIKKRSQREGEPENVPILQNLAKRSPFSEDNLRNHQYAIERARLDVLAVIRETERVARERDQLASLQQAVENVQAQWNENSPIFWLQRSPIDDIVPDEPLQRGSSLIQGTFFQDLILMAGPGTGVFGSEYLHNADYYIESHGYVLTFGFRNLNGQPWRGGPSSGPLLLRLGRRQPGDVLEDLPLESRRYFRDDRLAEWIFYWIGAYRVSGQEVPIRYTGLFRTSDDNLGFWYRIVRLDDPRAPRSLGGLGPDVQAFPVPEDFLDFPPQGHERWGSSWQNVSR